MDDYAVRQGDAPHSRDGRHLRRTGKPQPIRFVPYICLGFLLYDSRQGFLLIFPVRLRQFPALAGQARQIHLQPLPLLPRQGPQDRQGQQQAAHQPYHSLLPPLGRELPGQPPCQGGKDDT